MLNHVRTASGRRYQLLLSLLLILFAVGCTGDGAETNVETNDSSSGTASESVDGADGDNDSSTSGDNGESSNDPNDDVDNGTDSDSSEDEARSALEDLVVGLANGDYRSASRFVVNEGVSNEVVDQLGITEDQAYDSATLDQALADYCAAVDCSRKVEIGDVTTSDSMSASFTVLVEQSDGSTETVQIPLGSFEGHYTVARLPFGSASIEDNQSNRTVDGVPFYPGELAEDGWRLAPPAAQNPLVNLWDADEVFAISHLPGFTVTATGDFGELASTSEGGIVFQETGSVADGDFDDTIWVKEFDQNPEVVVAGEDGDLLLLEGARSIDLGEDIVYYQLRTGTTPEDTTSTLYSHNLATGDTETIAVVGGWESGVDFYDVNATYPVVAGMWRGEGFSGPFVLNFETGEVVYHADQVGISCFDGEAGCPAYWVVTMIDNLVYGLRPPDDAVEQQSAMSLHRFDPATGAEVEITRFAWDRGLWYPRSIMFDAEGLLISVEDGDGQALPAVLVDPDGGTASTLSDPGFVALSYLS